MLWYTGATLTQPSAEDQQLTSMAPRSQAGPHYDQTWVVHGALVASCYNIQQEVCSKDHLIRALAVAPSYMQTQYNEHDSATQHCHVLQTEKIVRERPASTFLTSA